MRYDKNFYQIKSNEDIFESIKSEVKDVGYYDLPLQDTQAIKTYTQKV